MTVTSAGVLLYRTDDAGVLQLWLVHMGGPFWARKDEHAWSIAKGEHTPDEDPLAAARREFAEELGRPAPDGALVDLGTVRQSGGKVVRAWAVQADLDVTEIHSNTFELEWPPRSGRMQEFPEVDRAGWFDLPTAAVKLVKGQRPLLERLADHAPQGVRRGSSR